MAVSSPPAYPVAPTTATRLTWFIFSFAPISTASTTNVESGSRASGRTRRNETLVESRREFAGSGDRADGDEDGIVSADAAEDSGQLRLIEGAGERLSGRRGSLEDDEVAGALDGAGE